MFPDFNIFSTPLLVLVLQGLVLVGMLLNKAQSKKEISSFILAILLLITCYHRTTYTIGFMGWYDSYRNTKINYYLIPLILGIGPLIYLYIQSVGVKVFRLGKKELFHFLPLFVFVLFRIILFVYDWFQPDFEQTQNGVLMQWVIENLTPLIAVVFVLHLLIYLIFSFQLYYKVRSRLAHQFSNTYQFELHWLRNFLFLFTFLFVYNILQMLTDRFIFELHWIQEWWFEFFSLLVVIYVGLKGYFTPIEHLPLLEPAVITVVNPTQNNTINTDVDYQKQLEPVKTLVANEALFLDSNLTLTKLSKKVKRPPSQLSMIINKGSGQNFNEFINSYRIALVKEKLVDKKYAHLSILAIALDCGFNSKATFNRVFKKLDGKAPSFYRE